MFNFIETEYQIKETLSLKLEQMIIFQRSSGWHVVGRSKTDTLK